MNSKKINHIKLTPQIQSRYRDEVDIIDRCIAQMPDYQPSIIFDLGANVGGMTIELAKKYPSATIYAFEPVHVTYELLKEHILLNMLSNVIVFNIGLSNISQKSVPIGMPSVPEYKTHNYGRATIKYFKGEPVDSIELVKFSDFCNVHNVRPDFIKMDIEGCEYDVLTDAKNAGILLNDVEVLYVEINNHYNTKKSAQLSKSLLLEDFTIAAHGSHNKNNKEPLNYVFTKKKN